MHDYAMIKDGKVFICYVCETQEIADQLKNYFGFDKAVKYSHLPKPHPQIGWNYDENNDSFSYQPSLHDIAQAKAANRMSFGSSAYAKIAKEVLTINLISAYQGNPVTVEQVQALNTQSVTLKSLLESGSLETSIQFLNALKSQYPVYTALADEVIASIQDFMKNE